MTTLIIGGIVIYLIGYFVYFSVHYRYLSLYYHVEDNYRKDGVNALTNTKAYKFAKTLFSFHNNDYDFNTSPALYIQSILWVMLLPIWIIYYIFHNLKITGKHPLIDEFEQFVDENKIEIEDLQNQLIKDDKADTKYMWDSEKERYKQKAIEILFNNRND